MIYICSLKNDLYPASNHQTNNTSNLQILHSGCSDLTPKNHQTMIYMDWESLALKFRKRLGITAVVPFAKFQGDEDSNIQSMKRKCHFDEIFVAVFCTESCQKCQLSLQTVTKMSLKWHFRFSVASSTMNLAKVTKWANTWSGQDYACSILVNVSSWFRSVPASGRYWSRSGHYDMFTRVGPIEIQ